MPTNTEIISWNVNGIRAAQKKGFIEWLHDRSPDVLCVQETKAHPDQLDHELLAPEGYHVFWSSAERKGYSGVATFCRKKPKSVSCGYNIPEFDNEGRVVVTEFEAFTLLNIYFPNGQKDETRLQYKLDFYDATLEFTEKLRKQGQSVIVSGDYNTAHYAIDLERPEANEKTSGFLPIERRWLDKFVDHGYIDTLRHFDSSAKRYTWWDQKTRARDRNVGWRIDYHFVSKELEGCLLGADILSDVYGSDHCPVTLSLRNVK